MKSVRWNDKEYKLYHVDELDEKEKTNLKSLGPEVKHGDWVLSADGYKVPILKTTLLGKYQFTITTPLGTFKSPHGIIHTETPYNGFGNGDSTWITGKQRKFAEVFAATRDRVESIWAALLSMKKVKNLVDQLTKEAMHDLGIDRLWILEGIKEIANDPDDKSRLSALKELSEIIGMKQKVTFGAQLPLSPEILKEITGESRGPSKLLTEYTEAGENEDNGGTKNESPEEDVQ
jgi:hypothetical protein